MGGCTCSLTFDPSGQLAICRCKSPRNDTYSYRSAIYAVSLEPLSANTSGTENPIHCEVLGFKPRLAQASWSGSANHSLRLSLLSASERNCASEFAMWVGLPAAVFNQNTTPALSRRNKSPNAILPTRVILRGHSHTSILREAFQLRDGRQEATHSFRTHAGKITPECRKMDKVPSIPARSERGRIASRRQRFD